MKIQKYLFNAVLSIGIFTAIHAHTAEYIEGYPKIIDGDTIKIDGLNIRLAGIDALEKKQICNYNSRKVECGAESTRELISIISARKVSCMYTKLDRYSRILGTCFVDGKNINKTMVRNGYALSYMSKEYSIDMIDAEQERKGIWKYDFQRPEDFRKKR